MTIGFQTEIRTSHLPNTAKKRRRIEPILPAIFITVFLQSFHSFEEVFDPRSAGVLHSAN
jgi:hypothetical protein